MTNKKNNKQQKTNNSPAQNSAQLCTLASQFSASFENASKVFKVVNSSELTIDRDESWIKTVLATLDNSEEASKIKIWVNEFAKVCKELGSYSESLNREYEKRWEQANAIGQQNELKQKSLIVRETELAKETEHLEKLANELEAKQIKLNAKNSELLDQEKSLREREINALSGFVAEKEKSLDELKKQQDLLVKHQEQTLIALRDERSQIEAEIRKANKKLGEIKDNCSDAEIAKIHALNEREFELQKKESALEKAEKRLDREWNELRSEKNAIPQKIIDELANEREADLAEKSKLEAQRQAAFEKLKAAKDELRDLEELKEMLGGQAPEDFLQKYETLKAKNSELKRKLEQSDTEGLRQEKEYLSERVTDLEKQLQRLQPELDEARRELSVKRVAATELEGIAREKRVLEQHRNTLTVHIDDLESRVEQLTNAQKAKTAFPAMVKMDSDKAYTAPIELEHIPDLATFSRELQHRIATAEKHVELYYPLKDIRILLGGLSMSQLHVFQGISGTGKTSLAKAFAKAMGGFCQDVSVQAGWRDRDDLLGHFNAFERKFYEKDCLQALYKAQTRRWEDTCNVILLDEMNLSRPEQYFAEFLSALEKNNPAERLISLAETELPGAPKLLREGRQILVPENVWFIGTANHDETTNELADKTYDRSHVMTLPKQDERFEINRLEPKQYSYQSLQKAFSDACKKHQQEVQGLLQQLTKDGFTKSLEKDFGLGWGNRFEKQALRFIPVMLAAGASKGDALDHLLATRVMRQGKVTNRFDVTNDALKNLQDGLIDFWSSARLDDIPVQSLELLEKDIKRKEGGF